MPSTATLLSFAAEAVLMLGVWEAGKKRARGQWLMLASQPLWLWFAWETQAWGMLPAIAFTAFTCVKYGRAWSHA